MEKKRLVALCAVLNNDLVTLAQKLKADWHGKEGTGVQEEVLDIVNATGQVVSGVRWVPP